RVEVEERPGGAAAVPAEALAEPARRRLRPELDPSVRTGPCLLLCVWALAPVVLESGRFAALAGRFAVRVGRFGRGRDTQREVEDRRAPLLGPASNRYYFP